MSDLKLVIGDKNSSTWSLCAWLTLKQLGLEFEEVVVARHLPDARERILQHSLSGKLPLLVVGEIKVWDSLAINEFLADHFDGLWPVGAAARAVARSVAAEAHSGFRDLHTFLPMDVTARFGPPGRLLSDPLPPRRLRPTPASPAGSPPGRRTPGTARRAGPRRS